MSQENVEIVVGAIERALEDPESFFSILDQHVEWDVPGPPDTAETFHGPEGVREFFRRWIAPFDDFGYEAEEVIDAGDSVIVLLHQWGRGKNSGVTVDSRFWQVWNLRGGKVVRFTHFLDKDEALEAVGLSE